MASLGSLVAALDHIRARPETFYVYELRRPGGEPFYVGKGTGDRIRRHEYDATHTRRKSYRLNVIRQLLREGLSVEYRLVGFYGDECDAFGEEARLIALYGRYDLGRGPLTNKTDGGEGAANPSASERERRSALMRERMADPDARENALRAMRTAETRKERAAAALCRPEVRERLCAARRRHWSDSAARARHVAAITANRPDDWKARQADGVRRVQSDPEYHRRRNEGFHRSAVPKIRAWAQSPEGRAVKREIGRRASADIQRRRREVMAFAESLGAVVRWPHHSSGLSVWNSIAARLAAGERAIA